MLSNEPGYYKPGEYGIRVENLVLIEQRAIPGGDPDRAMLGFETLTFAPIERALIAPALLTSAERAWLDAYHARVVDVIGPLLAGEDRAWLTAKCAPLS
jgi:Xaa-Pro aminopeptidase